MTPFLQRLRPLCAFLAATLFFSSLGVSVLLAHDEDSRPELQIATGHTRNTDSPVVLSRAGLLFTRDNHGEIKAWDVPSGKVLKNWALPTLYEGIQKPVHIPDRGLIALACHTGIYFIREADLSQAAYVRENRIASPFYDTVTKRFFCTSPSPQGLRILEVDLDTFKFKNGPNGAVRLPNPPDNSQLNPYNVLSLPDGRLMVQFSPSKHGSALLDPNDWSKVQRLPEEDRRILHGMPGELVAVKGGDLRIEILDARTLEVLRGAEVPREYRTSISPLVFSGVSENHPGAPSQLVFRGYRMVLFVDPQTLRVTRKYDLQKDLGPAKYDASGLEPLSGDEWLMTSWGRPLIVNWRESRVVRELGIGTYLGSRLSTTPTGFNFFVWTFGASSRRVDFTEDGVNVTGFDNPPLHVAHSPDGRWVVFNHHDEKAVHISSASDFPRKDRVFNRTLKVALPVRPNFVFSPDGRWLGVLSPNSAHIYEIATGRLVFEADSAKSSASMYWLEGFGTFSGDGKYFAQLIASEDAGKKYYRQLRVFDLDTGAVKWSTLANLAPLAYSPDGNELLAIDPEGKAVVYLDAQTGAVLRKNALPQTTATQPIIRWRLSADRRFLLAYGGRQLTTYSTDDWSVRSVHSLPGHTVEDVQFFAKSDFFLTLSADNRLRVWKVGQPQPLGIFTLFSNGRDWCFNTPDFHFQASPDGMREVYFVKGRSIIPLESLFEQFFTPKLATRLFAGEQLQPAVDVAKIKLPPRTTLALDTGTRGLIVEDDIASVKSAEAQVKIVVTATSPQEAISELRLYHNDKLVQTATRGLVVEDDPDARSEKRTFPITLLPGENTFRAIAINAQRVESLPAELVVRFTPPASGPAVVAGENDAGGGLQLHLVVVGLNKYRNPRFNLNYAVADATAVREQIEKRAAGMFTKINAQLIFDEKAVKPAIVAAFQKVAAEAGPRDAFIFYYAGHGVMSGEAKSLFYLVPHDVTQMYGADDRLASAAISSVELQELSRLIPAQKQLFVLDACQSAGAIEAIAVRGAAEQKAIAQLARSSGTHWLTASGSEQFATEFEQLGHGAFTYVLLQGLEGKADSGDGRVTVNELKAWLESELPEVTAKHKGTPQFPASYGFGQDFPLTLRQ